MNLKKWVLNNQLKNLLLMAIVIMVVFKLADITKEVSCLYLIFLLLPQIYYAFIEAVVSTKVFFDKVKNDELEANKDDN